jgi:hypothetical protein
LKDSGAVLPCEFQKIKSAEHACLGGLDGVSLIIYGRGRAGEIIDLIDTCVERKHDVMFNKPEAVGALEMIDVAFVTGHEIIEAKDLMAVIDQTLAQMRA